MLRGTGQHNFFNMVYDFFGYGVDINEQMSYNYRRHLNCVFHVYIKYILSDEIEKESMEFQLKDMAHNTHLTSLKLCLNTIRSLYAENFLKYIQNKFGLTLEEYELVVGRRGIEDNIISAPIGYNLGECIIFFTHLYIAYQTLEHSWACSKEIVDKYITSMEKSMNISSHLSSAISGLCRDALNLYYNIHDVDKVESFVLENIKKTFKPEYLLQRGDILDDVNRIEPHNVTPKLLFTKQCCSGQDLENLIDKAFYSIPDGVYANSRYDLEYLSELPEFRQIDDEIMTWETTGMFPMTIQASSHHTIIKMGIVFAIMQRMQNSGLAVYLCEPRPYAYYYLTLIMSKGINDVLLSAERIRLIRKNLNYFTCIIRRKSENDVEVEKFIDLLLISDILSTPQIADLAPDLETDVFSCNNLLRSKYKNYSQSELIAEGKKNHNTLFRLISKNELSETFYYLSEFNE